MGCVFAYVIILALVGPENLGQKFGVAHDSDMEDAAGREAMAAVVAGDQDAETSSGASERDMEKEGGGDRNDGHGTKVVQREDVVVR